jgi:hypothetical protein
MGEDKVVNIKLDYDQNTRVLKVEEIIHPREFELVINLIKKSFSKAEEKPAEPEKDSKNIYRTRYHDTIVVSGSRGTGKTTFLMTLLKGIESGEIKQKGGEHSDNLSKIKVLPILDPTLIELKAHPFVTIISLIYDAVAESIDCCRVHCDDKLDKKLEEWKDCFNSLAEGLPVLDGIGNGALTGTEWDDPEYVMKEGIRKAKAANNLEENFNRFVEESLKLLNKGAFLICFDDIDTDFTKGWPILEILRKYLTSSKIITILSGDLELYSAIVRKSQWNNIGIDRVKGETTDQLQKFKDLVSQLENQYLLKLLRPERRITLNSIFSNIYQNRIVYKINDIEIQKYYEGNLLEKYSFKSEAEKKIIIGFVENLPIRTQIQLLLALEEDNGEKVKSIFNVFWNNWNEWNSNNSIIFDQPEVIPLVVIRFLLANDLIEDGNSLLPNNSNFSKSASLFVAGIYYQSLTKTRPSFIFEYFLRIALTHEVSEVLYSTSSPNKKEDFESFVDHCKIIFASQLRTISGRYNSIALTATITNKQQLIFEPVGCIEIYNRYKFSKEQKDIRIDSILENSRNKIFSTIGLLPVSVIMGNRGISPTVYSIFNLLAVIGDLFKNKTDDVNDIMRFLRESSDILSYPKLGGIESLENVIRRQKMETDENDSQEELIEENDPEFKQFAASLLAWMKKSENDDWLIPSTYLLSNIMSRFYYNLKSISPYNFDNVGDWMSFVVSILLNSVIIEEYFWNKSLDSDFKIRHSKLSSSNRYFVANLRVVLQNIEKFGFSVWLMQCPLLTVFIDFKELSVLTPDELQEIFGVASFENLIEILKIVPLKDEKSKSASKSPTKKRKSNSESLDEYLLKDTTVQKIIEYCRKNNISDSDIDKINNFDFKNSIIKPALELKGNFKITVYRELRIAVKAGLQQ